jgi:hypothetical protein
MTKIKKTLAAFAASTALSAPAAHATPDLNAPPDKQTTVLSEILRGEDAAQQCPLSDAAAQYSYCIDEILGRAAERDSDYQPFKFGVLLAAWLNREEQVDADRIADDVFANAGAPLPPDREPLRSDLQTAKYRFDLMREAQVSLSLTNEQVISVSRTGNSRFITMHLRYYGVVPK